MLAAVTNLTEYTVTELAFSLKRTVEEAYGLLRVRGELSGYKRAASGHLYFTLKDEKACIDAVAWRGSVPKLAFEPADGLEVICTGRLTTYPGRSKYQLVVERIEPAGLGALMALLEERRKALAAEGLFDVARKRSLPFLPEVVGVVTSPTGAVIRDILHRLGDRFPRRVLVWPVLVQGEGAAAQIAAAIDGFSALPQGGSVPRPDVVIVARGGGSIEDLWAFNERAVAQAVFESAIPVVSAVGHETDFTICDFVADLRAATPTAAATLVTPDGPGISRHLDALAGRLARAADHALASRTQRLDLAARGLQHPRARLDAQRARLADIATRITAGARRTHALSAGRGAALGARYLRELVRPIDGARRTVAAGERLAYAARRGRESSEVRLAAAARALAHLNPSGVLERGYAIVADGAGRIVQDAAALAAGDRLSIALARGRVGAVVDRVERETHPPEAAGTDPVPDSPGT